MSFEITTFWIFAGIFAGNNSAKHGQFKIQSLKYKQVWEEQVKIAFVSRFSVFNNLNF